MPLVVGISFKRAGKIYYFDPAGSELHEGDFVVAETARGIEFGEVLMEPKVVPVEEIYSPLKKIVRKATQADINREELNKNKEKHAYQVCQQKVQAHGLPMKLIDAEYGFDGSQVTFYFSAEARVDFRELVKDLAAALRAKVQLHQVGVRDEAKLFGGMGPCGRQLCCASFLNGFEPVSMKMAKEQCLFLNPLKFSGICGKLMCCLKYEYQNYKEAKERLPAMNSFVDTPAGRGKVFELNVIKETFGVQLEDGTTAHFSVSDLSSAELPCALKGDGCGKCCETPQPKPTIARPPAPTAAPEPAKPATAGGNPPANPAGEQERPKRRNRPRRRPNRRRGPDQQGGQANNNPTTPPQSS